MPTPLDRVFEIAECNTQTELAEFLGITQSSVSDAMKRESIAGAAAMLLQAHQDYSS